MEREQQELTREMQGIVAEMQRAQGLLGADRQPLSMHEIDFLKRLGIRYAELVERLDALPKP